MRGLKPISLLARFPHLFPCTYSTSTFFDSHITSFLSIQTSSLQSLLQLHALIISTGNSNNIFIASKLISLYASLPILTSSAKVFHSVNPKDTFLWNSIVKSHFSNGKYLQAFDFYLRMRASGAQANNFTVPMVVATCAELLLLDDGKKIHGLVLKLGLFEGNAAVGSAFVYMYSKCGQMDEASLMFDEMPRRDVVAWTALVIGYLQNGQSDKGLECLCEMHKLGENGEKPNFRTLEGGFHACGDLGSLIEGRCLHGFSVKTGIGCSPLVQSSVLSMYSKCGTLKEACCSFHEVINKDIFSWTSVIGVYAKFEYMTECLSMFWDMQVANIYPDGIVISCMLCGFGNAMMVMEGKAFHGLIIRRNYVLDQMVYNALLSMYCKLEHISLAEKLFDKVHERHEEPWNTMIIGCGKVGHKGKCLELFREMQHLGLESDSSSLVSAISSCSDFGGDRLTRSLHCYSIKSFKDENISVANSLIGMYGRNGNLTIAWRIFSRIQKNTVTWNTIIASYTHNAHYLDALTVFDRMISENIEPNTATLVTVLSACANLASLEKGERIHNYIKARGIEYSLSLSTVLVDMYAKCGQLQKSRELFDSIVKHDTISWNVMISGYAMHGDAESALEIFHQMEKSNVEPNELTFLALLSACTHAGLVKEGKYLFGRMQYLSLKPNLKHYACMVDLLGRSGYLQEAEALILSMPISPDSGVWGALLSACKLHNEIEMGIRIAKLAIQSDPHNDGYYVMVSDMYSSTGRWQEAEMMRNIMKDRGVGKIAGWSTL